MQTIREEYMVDLDRLDEAERNLMLSMMKNGMAPSQAVGFVINFGDC